MSQNWETNLTTALQQFNAFVQAQVTIPIYNVGTIYQGRDRHGIFADPSGQGACRPEAHRSRHRARHRPGQRGDRSGAQLEAAKAQILATHAQVAAAEIALNGVREEARVGQRTTLDVLNAQQDLVTARTALVTAQHDRVVASYSLLAAVGELNLPKLGIGIPLYDPMVHYQQVRDAWIGVRTPDGR